MGEVLVTGAAGFAGSHLLQQLAREADVVAWTRTSTPPAFLAGTARWRQVDLLDRTGVRAAVAELRPSCVYHCAGRAQASGSWQTSTGLLAANVLGTQHLLDALRRTGMACRVLLPGSALVYATSPDPISEDHPIGPAGPYALSKLAQEQLGLRADRDGGVEVLLTRSFNHTGPRQAPAFVAPALARQIARIEAGTDPPVVRVGNLHAVRDISDVRDVVRAYRLLMAHGEPGTVYNVASGIGRSIQSVLEALVARARRPVRIVHDPSRLRAHDVSQVVGNADRIRSAVGWAPDIPFEQTVDDLLEYWRVTVASGASG